MSQPTPQVLQTYTLLQIGAEALFGQAPNRPAARAGNGALTIGDIDPALLTTGNGHSTRMTQQQAEQFAREWKVISRQPNTATGFSATLG